MHSHTQLLGNFPAPGRLGLGTDVGCLDAIESGVISGLKSNLGHVTNDHRLTTPATRIRGDQRKAWRYRHGCGCGSGGKKPTASEWMGHTSLLIPFKAPVKQFASSTRPWRRGPEVDHGFVIIDDRSKTP